MLHKIQDTADSFILLLSVITEAVTIYMDVKSAGRSLMRAIAQIYRFFHYLLPAELLVIIKGHRMCYQLHAVVERAVALDVYVFLVFIGNSENLIGIIAVFACSVNFKFNTEISVRIAIEYRLGFVSVIMDASVFVNFVVVTIAAIIVTVKVISIVLMNKSVTAGTAGIVVVVAVGAKCCVLVAVAVVSPDNRAAAVTGGGVVFVAIGADDITVYSFVVIVFDKSSAV